MNHGSHFSDSFIIGSLILMYKAILMITACSKLHNFIHIFMDEINLLCKIF